MSNNLEEWLQNLEVPSTPWFVPLLSESIDVSVFYDIPSEHFAEFVRETHNGFAEALPESKKSLRDLERSLPSRLEPITKGVSRLGDRIEQTEANRRAIMVLSERFDSIREAEGKLPDGVKPIGESLLYQADTEVFGKMVCFRPEDPLLKFVAFGRLMARRQRERHKELRNTLAVGRLRLAILKGVLSRFDITGLPPNFLSLEQAKEQIKQLSGRSSTASKGGRPLKGAMEVDPEKRQDIIEEKLRDPQNWHHQGRHRGKPRWGNISAEVAAEHPEFFKGDSKFGLTDSRITQLVKEWGINLGKIRGELGIPDPY